MPSVRVDDLDVAYDVSGPETSTPVLMINGLGAARGGWAQQVPALAAEYRVVTYDNRDVGETGAGTDPRPYPLRQFADDAVGLMDALGITRAHIVGASMGGAIAQELALAYPNRVVSLSIVCSWAKTDPWLAELFRSWEEVFAAQGMLAFSRTTWLWVMTYRWYQDPERLAALVADTEAAPYPQTAEMYARQSQAAIGHDALDRLSNLAIPTHVIAGEEDLLTPVRFSEEIAAAIPGARLTVMPEVGHGMFWEATDAFNDHVLGFLRQVD